MILSARYMSTSDSLSFI